MVYHPRMQTRTQSYGECSKPLLLDRLGIYFSNRTVIRCAQKHKPRRVLEIGCGFHYPLLRLLEPYAGELVGVDVATAPSSSAKISLLTQKINEDLDFLGGQSFDLIVMISVLEHLRNPQNILEEIHRLLTPGGIFLCNVPTWRGQIFLEWAAFRLGKITPAEIDDHKMYYDKRSLWPMLVAAGFKPSGLRLSYRKGGLALFAEAAKPLSK